MSLYYQDDHVTLYHGDCLDVLGDLPDESVDAVVTDPPYGLEFMGKCWDAPWQAGKGTGEHNAGFSPGAPAVPGVRGEIKSLPSYMGSTNPTCRNCGGTRNGNDRVGRRACRCGKPEFPNIILPRMKAFQDWCEQWAAECLRVLKPGGHMVAFGGTRTFHRLTAGIEDAGFEIRDVLSWLYGSGFPKSMDVSKAIDKRPGVMHHAEFARHLTERRESAGLSRSDVSERVVGARTGACWNWEHHQFPEARWWPALRDLLDMDEARWGPIIAEVERVKTGRVTSVTGHRQNPSSYAHTEGVNEETTAGSPEAAQWEGWGTALKPAWEPIILARKPLAGTVAANVLTHGTGALNIDACRIPMSDEDRAAIDAKHAGMDLDGYQRVAGVSLNLSVKPMPLRAAQGHELGRFPANVLIDDTAGVAIDQQTGVTRSRVGKPRAAAAGSGWGMTATGAEYDDEGGASRFFYSAKADSAERPVVDGVAHPTVKPLALMEWLIRLVTPPGGTVLEPFAGSGTTLEAAQYTGHRAIGIEKGDEYLPLIVHRLERTDPRVRAPKPLEVHPDQLDLLQHLGGIA